MISTPTPPANAVHVQNIRLRSQPCTWRNTGNCCPISEPGIYVSYAGRTCYFSGRHNTRNLTALLLLAILKANVDVTLRELARLAVGQSDNGAEEVLIRLVGGPPVVQSYIRSLGISAFHLVYCERVSDCDENLQYQDWIEPAVAVRTA